MIYKVSQTYEDVESYVRDTKLVDFSNTVLEQEKQYGDYDYLLRAETINQAIGNLTEMGYECVEWKCLIVWEDGILTVCK